MKLKEKRQKAMIDYLNLIYDLEITIQSFSEEIYSIPSIQEESNDNPTSFELIFQTIGEIQYRHGWSYNILIGMLETAIELNRTYKLGYSLEFDDNIRIRIEAMKEKAFFGKPLISRPVMERTPENLKSSIALFEQMKGIALRFTEEARKHIDLNTFDYRLWFVDDFHKSVWSINSHVDLMKNTKTITATERCSALLDYLDKEEFDFGLLPSTEFFEEHYPPIEKPIGENVIKRQNTINEKEVERRAIAQAAAIKQCTDEHTKEKLKPLQSMIDYLDDYFIRNDKSEWDEYHINVNFKELDRYGNIQDYSMIRYLTSLIDEIAERIDEDPSSTRNYQERLDIQTFAHFIVNITQKNY